MEEPVIQTPSAKFPFIPIIISVILAALVFGGGVFLWMDQKQHVLTTKNISLRNQADQLNQASAAATAKSTPETPEARQARIEQLKASPELTVDNIYDLQQVIPFSQWKDLFGAARKQVVENSAKGMEFDLVFTWKKGNWVYFNVISENNETDIGQLYLEKVDNNWKAYGPGTDFPDLYEQHPELFK